MQSFGYHSNRANRSLQRSRDYFNHVREVRSLIPSKSTTSSEKYGKGASSKEQAAIRGSRRMREYYFFVLFLVVGLVFSIAVLYTMT